MSATAEDLGKMWTEIQAEEMRRSLRSFVAGAWHIVEPGTEYVPGWHIDAICDHLTYVSLGDIKDLVINIPPRHSKSTIVAVMWPAWMWTWQPTEQWMFCTYAQDLTLRDSVKCRNLIMSSWYQERWGHVYKIKADLNQKKRFANDKNGYRLATSVEGQATGEGGSKIVLDDPHNMAEINSDVERQNVIDWWRNVMPTRGNNPKTANRVVIAQRGHHMDLCGYLLGQGGWVHLNLPGYFMPKTRCTTTALKSGYRVPPHLRKNPAEFRVGDDVPPLKKGQTIFVDPRKKADELLAPGRFGAEEMANLAVELTDQGFAAQIQQTPSMEGGNILKKKHWREWLDAEMPHITYVLQCYDTAFEEEEANDFSARTTWGVFEYEEQLDPSLPWTAAYKGQKRMCLMLLERMNERLDYPKLRAEMLKSAKLWKPDKILIEKKASGHSLIQEFRKKLPITGIKVSDSKFMRAHAASLVLERGCVFYVPRRWASEVIEQCGQFPVGEHDDVVDTVTMALLWLRRMWNAGFIDDEEDDINLTAHLHRRDVQTYGGIRTGA